MAAIHLTARSFQTAFAALKPPVPMGQIFALAKTCRGMSIDDIEKLLTSKEHKIRVGAVSIMDWDARDRKTTPARRKALFDLYIRRHDCIDNWDLVDRSAPSVVGGYLADKPRWILDTLARSESTWERRTAIVSTYHFIRLNQLDDTFRVAELLVNDAEDLVQKAVGGWVREAGKRDGARLLAFLERHAATMPRTMLRYAIEKLPKAKRESFMGMKAGSAAAQSEQIRTRRRLVRSE
jgi:DNA alkylation repair enzyme